MANKRYPGVYLDKDGTYYIQPRIKDIYGNIKRPTIRGFKTQKAAFEAKEEKMRKLEISSNKFITYKNAFLENLKYKLDKGKIGESTYNTVLRRNELHILPKIGNTNIFDITVQVYRDLQLELKKEGLNIRTINGLHSDVVSTLKYSTLFHNLEYNVAIMVGPVYVDRDNINSFITIDDMKKINKEDSLDPSEWELITKYYENLINAENNEEKKIILIKEMLVIICEYILMMRVGEVQAVSYDYIYFEKKFIFLNKAYSKNAKKITPLKNRETRFIYLPDSVFELFKLCYESDKKFKEFKKEDLVFGYTGHFSRTNILRRLKKIMKELEIDKNLSNHKLRHSGISYQLYEGQDPTAIATFAGHNKEMTMNQYNQVLGVANKELVDSLSKLYVPKITKSDSILTSKF